jgi:hypothetical protein
MRSAAIVSALFATLLLSMNAAQAQRYVASGQTLKLTFFCNINPDCSAAGAPTIRITKPPEHGRVSVTHTRDFCQFPPSNPRNVCNTRRVAGVAARYIAPRNYTGYDSVGVEVFFPSGQLRTGTYNISVR